MKTRRKAITFAVIVFGTIIILGRSVFTLASLLFEDASTDSIPTENLHPILNGTANSTQPAVIPKILHQTYKNDTIPSIWKEAQQSCKDLHPDYEYILWTDEMAHDFIATHYPWFLDTFDQYKYPIQRADSIRYFILAHMGGIYLDLDNGCNRRLDPLRAYPAWVRRTSPTGISNDAMGSVPKHPFFIKVIQTLQSYDRNWLFPYITIMYSTGPLFLSVMWKEYMRTQPTEKERVRVLMADDYMHQPWSFFTHHLGNSWHRSDAVFIFWMEAHWKILTLCGILALGLIGVCFWMGYSRLVLYTARYYYGYTRTSTMDPSSATDSDAGYDQGTIRGVGRYFRFRKADAEQGLRSVSKPRGLDD